MAHQKLNDSFYISTLLVKMVGDQLTAKEQADLDAWLAADPRNIELQKKLLDERLRNHDIKTMNAFDTDEALEKMVIRIRENGQSKVGFLRKRGYPYKIAAAAVVLIVLSVSLKLYYDKRHQQAATTIANQAIPVNNNKILLTLSNGATIDVESAKNGAIARQGYVLIHKTPSGGIDYQTDTSQRGEENAKAAYNTLTVPRGQQYQLILPDGSQVWLNSQSSLKYPVAFNGKERIVELSGEAYFEVTHLTHQPFKVKTNDQVVEVLGTHFNIQAYPDEESTQTTLAKGSVKVTKGTQYLVIKPGQMAVNMVNDSQLSVHSANLDEVLGWKNGLLSFSDDPIEQIMSEAARAYDIDVQYQGDIKGKRFWGIYPRSKGLANLLKNLEQTHTIHFKVQGRRVLVMP